MRLKGRGMYGVVTRNAEEITWPEFDTAFYEVKDVSGRISEPVANAVNMISCFGDNAAAEADPSLVPIDPDGNRATRDQPYFDWAYICPTNTDYQRGLLETIEDCTGINPDVRLDDIGFPRQEYCYCDRCNHLFEQWVTERYETGTGPSPEKTTRSDRYQWRAQIISKFVEAAADRIPGSVYMTLYPDPYEGHLFKRAGINLDTLEEHVDEFVIPLYDTAYETTYWVEIIASGFADRLNTPLTIELYSVNLDLNNLSHATDVAAEYSDTVLFGYDAATARGLIRRKAAEANEGKTWKE